MNICLYTISNFVDNAINCIDLLLESINKDIKFDFFILTDQKKLSSNIKHKAIYDNSIQSNYIGYLKYSKKLPDDYEYYVYLDSDILFFDSIFKLLPINKDFTIVRENTLIQKNPWYYFTFVNQNEDAKLQYAQALNAGTFAFHNDKRYVLNEIIELYAKYHTNESYDVLLEQSIFNYVVNKYHQYDLSNCLDFTDATQLFASIEKIHQDKKLYHFCGYTNEMSSKYIKMRDFYTLYKKIT